MASSSDKTHWEIGSRKSKLALVQTYDVISQLKELWPGHTFVVHEQETQGDKILDKALSKIGSKGLFTQDLEDRLIDGSIDFAVHSLKDLATRLPDGLTVGCILKRINPIDVLLVRSDLVSRGIRTLADLNSSLDPSDRVVGTSSLRRQSQIQYKYPNIQCIDIRGNVDTRLNKLEARENFPRTYAAIVLAHAGLERQGEKYTSLITEYIDTDDMFYAVGQAALGIECRSNDTQTLALLAKIHHSPTEKVCKAERSLLRELEGGCHAPIGVRSKISQDETRLQLAGRVLSLDGKVVVQDSIEGDINDYENLGIQLAKKLLEAGAAKILKDIEKASTQS